MRHPKFSVIMYLEETDERAERSLFALTSEFQREVTAEDYEVIVVDNSAEDGLRERWGERFPGFRFLRFVREYETPWEAVNFAVGEARSEKVLCCLQGARILSPGALKYALSALNFCQHPFVYTLDMCLESVDDEKAWRSDGYSLFTRAHAIGGEDRGFFSRMNGSGCFGMTKRDYIRIGGLEEGFRTPIPGLAERDLFNRVHEEAGFVPVLLLGEASFAQRGACVADAALSEAGNEEFLRIRGKAYKPLFKKPAYLGWISQQYHVRLLHSENSLGVGLH